MAQTPGYEYDIFISYAHDDNYPLGAGDNGWVTQFHELLSNWLTKQRGLKDLKIWFDKTHLGGNTRFDDAIKRGIESSALFFVIHSRNYQNSPYCNQELNWFLDHNQRYRNGVRVGDESRLFNIQIQNIHFDQWSEKLAGTSDFVMHDAKGDELGFPILSTDAQFNKPMRQIIEATEKTLAALAAHSARPEPEPQKAGQNTPKIFIANVPDTLKSFKKQLINEIGDKATILDDLPPPFPAAEHAKQLQTTLDQSSLSIHLLDQHSGMEIFDAGDGSTYPKAQADTARQREQKSLIWVPESLNSDDIEDFEQAIWLNELENGHREYSSHTFVRSTRQAFINQVIQELDQLQYELSLKYHEKQQSKIIIVPDLNWVEVQQWGNNFYVSKYPITNSQFQTFIDDGGYQDSAWWRGLPRADNTPSKWPQSNRPKTNLYFHEAIAFTRWLSHRLSIEARLPTEKEWEYMAYGNNNTKYPWGDDYLPNHCNLNDQLDRDNSINQTIAVGMFPHGDNSRGVSDTLGNIWEFCRSEEDNDMGVHTLRGCSWDSQQVKSTLASKSSIRSNERDEKTGFRIVTNTPERIFP